MKGFFLSILLFGFSAKMAVALEKDYLEAAKADVAEFSTGDFSLPPGNSWVKNDKADKSLSTLKGFSAFLKKRTPGTHIIFTKLHNSQKIQVWEAFVDTGDFKSIRKNIFRMYKAQSR